MTTAAEPGHSTTSKNATGWRFRVAIDGYNLGLSDEQCNLAFPEYYEEIDRALKWRMKRNLSRITPAQLDTSWRPELIRILLYERQADHGYDVPRAIALLQQIHRSIIGYQGVLPNVEFTISLGDWPKDPHDKWPIWVLTRHKQEFDKWVVPDFGYWSWPLGVLGDYTQFRRDVEENEVSWKDKIKKVVWRGSVKTNKLREDLVAKSQGRAWSDIHEVQWLNITTMEEKSSKRSLTMADHCNYQFAVHTEGHIYSGRGKYLLNCKSVSIVHDPNWIEPHTHLMIEAGAEQNIIRVKRDFSDLNEKMKQYSKQQRGSEQIAMRSAAMFRDQYLTPAAQACYWRKLFKAWASVSFEPELYYTMRDDLGRVRRRSRGVPFETFMALLILPVPKK